MNDVSLFDVDEITPNIGLTKPAVGASDDTWGEKLNTNFDIIDNYSGSTKTRNDNQDSQIATNTTNITAEKNRNDTQDTNIANNTSAIAANTSAIATKVAKAGDTMTGPLVLPADPTTALQASTKQYVDSKPAPPNPATAIPLISSGTGAVGTSVKYAREDHVHPAGGGGISDAPFDGQYYARRNGVWVPIREKLTANRIYYVSITGNDSNDGLSPSTPFATIQKAINASTIIDLNGFAVTIQLAASVSSYAGFNCSVPFVGGNVTVLGDTTTPGNCIINGQAYASGAGTKILIAGLKMINGAVQAQSLANIAITGRMEYGAVAGGAHINAGYGAVVSLYNQPKIISGSAAYHLYANSAGIIMDISAAVTITGTPGFTYFSYCTSNSSIDSTSSTFSGAVTAGTQRYLANFGGGIATGSGASATFYPGGVAGNATSPGWYN